MKHLQTLEVLLIVLDVLQELEHFLSQKYLVLFNLILFWTVAAAAVRLMWLTVSLSATPRRRLDYDLAFALCSHLLVLMFIVNAFRCVSTLTQDRIVVLLQIVQIIQPVFEYLNETVENEVRLALWIRPLDILIEVLERQIVTHDHVDVEDVQFLTEEIVTVVDLFLVVYLV